jgi:hypothetical protein
MDKLLFAKRKIERLNAEISRVRTSDFHHPGAKIILNAIERRISRVLLDLESVPPNASADILNQHNLSTNIIIRHFHPIIGIILRSTNARNSFELYDPLLRLAQRLIDKSAVLILSSEWDVVPFATSSAFEGAANCTIVGLPVMEAGNALITPLAGHELGHSIWRSKQFGNLLAPERENALCEQFLRDWEPFKKYTKVRFREKTLRDRLAINNEWDQIPLSVIERVSEEIFCDMLAVRLFGMGYLYAFEYLAAPSLGRTELREYPAFDKRARYLSDTMNEIAPEETEWPGLDGYAERFTEEPPGGLEAYDRFLLDAAHLACEGLVPRLREMAVEVCSANYDHPSAVRRPTLDAARKALSKLESGLPAEADLADVVNAGWLGYLDPAFWTDKPAWEKRKFAFLNELILKSLDVTEFAKRCPQDAAKD